MGEGANRGKRGRSSRTVYKEPMGKTKGGKDWGWDVGVGEMREGGGRKTEATVFGQKFLKMKIKTKRKNSFTGLYNNQQGSDLTSAYHRYH